MLNFASCQEIRAVENRRSVIMSRGLRRSEVARSRFGKFRVCDTITRLTCEQIINLLHQFHFCNEALVCFPARPRLWITTDC